MGRNTFESNRASLEDFLNSKMHTKTPPSHLSKTQKLRSYQCFCKPVNSVKHITIVPFRLKNVYERTLPHKGPASTALICDSQRRCRTFKPGTYRTKSALQEAYTQSCFRRAVASLAPVVDYYLVKVSTMSKRWRCVLGPRACFENTRWEFWCIADEMAFRLVVFLVSQPDQHHHSAVTGLSPELMK